MMDQILHNLVLCPNHSRKTRLDRQFDREKSELEVSTVWFPSKLDMQSNRFEPAKPADFSANRALNRHWLDRQPY